MVRVPDTQLRQWLADHQIRLGDATPVAAIGVRGWANSGAGGGATNLTGVYDDALCVVRVNGSWTFQGNTDPTRTIEGRAILQPGVYEYGPGVHNITKPATDRRLAFTQRSGVTIRRFDAQGALGPELENQWIGCNHHDGAESSTGSAACQTVAPEWWPGYAMELIHGLRLAFSEWATLTTRIKNGGKLPEDWTKASFPYLLVDAP